jgi:two-component system, OmpR family, sensor histidine kinase ChvG
MGWGIAIKRINRLAILTRILRLGGGRFTRKIATWRGWAWLGYGRALFKWKRYKLSLAVLRRLLPSFLTLRILALNILALMIPIVGLLFLGRYQQQLISRDLTALQSQALVMADALAEAAATYSSEDERYQLTSDAARNLVRRLAENSQIRTRLYDTNGELIVDSHILEGPGGVILIDPLPPPLPQNLLARWTIGLYEQIIGAIPRPANLVAYPQNSNHASDFPEVVRALGGERLTGQWLETSQRLQLTSAVPVQRYKQVLGALLLSRDAREIDTAVRNLRFEILRLFILGLAATILLSLYLARTIARPIRQLAKASEVVRYGGGARLHALPDFHRRHDEIGDLSAALRAMTSALWERLDAIERFAADVAHELKNPLTSLRSAIETLPRLADPQRQARLLQIIQEDVDRLDRLISDISDASRLDAELSRALMTPVDIIAMLAMLVELHETTRTPNIPALELYWQTRNGRLERLLAKGDYSLQPGQKTAKIDDLKEEDSARGEKYALEEVYEAESFPSLKVNAIEGRLVQVFRNLLANALSFSPPDAPLRFVVKRLAKQVEIRVEDCGPGIPPGKLGSIFARFYSERPIGEKFGTHSGLGLAISRQIIEAHGGEILAENRQDENGIIIGACFIVRLGALD